MGSPLTDHATLGDEVNRDDGRHRNDIYGDRAEGERKSTSDAAIPAATVVLLRDRADDVEVLMLRKTSKISFGGMWVFPGGRIDDADFQGTDDLESAARNAAARETAEEAGITVDAGRFEWFSHWTPPAALGPHKRFATWFFAARIDDDQDVCIDEGEITEHAWLSPRHALQRHAAGEIDLAPPTWITLYHLSRYAPTHFILEHFRANEAKVYVTRVGVSAEGHRVSMWRGDAGHGTGDADTKGPRHRLVMAKDGFRFENTIEPY